MSNQDSTPTQEQLRTVLHYDPAVGVFTWVARTSPRAKVGAVAGSQYNKGYWRLSVFGETYLAHRLAWLYVYGYLPSDGQDIDHINGNRTDNRISNLRLTNRSENNQNRHSACPRSKTGHIGVCWSKQNKKWAAQIGVGGKVINLGHFDLIEDAVAARAAGKKKYHTHGNM